MRSGEWLLNWGCMSLGVMSTFLEAETSVVVQQCPCTKYHWILHIWMVSFTLYEFHLNFLKWKKSLLLHHNQMTWKAAEMWGHVWLGEPVLQAQRLDLPTCPDPTWEKPSAFLLRLHTCPASPCSRKGNWILRTRLLPILDFSRAEKKYGLLLPWEQPGRRGSSLT